MVSRPETKTTSETLKSFAWKVIGIAVIAVGALGVIKYLATTP